MTSYVFTPNPTSNFTQFMALDGVSYTVSTAWNMYGERYYLVVTDTQDNQVLRVPLVASPDFYDINLLAGYFAVTTFIYRASSSTFEVSP